jgi:hypothetical protein
MEVHMIEVSTALTLCSVCIHEAFGLPARDEKESTPPRVVFLSGEDPFFVTCTPHDVWFDAPSRAVVWDGTGDMPRVLEEEAWVNKGGGWYHAYLPRTDATFVATEVNGCPERVFVWLDPEGGVPHADAMLEALRTYRAKHKRGKFFG